MQTFWLFLNERFFLERQTFKQFVERVQALPHCTYEIALVFATHLARTLGMFCGILNPTLVALTVLWVSFFGFPKIIQHFPEEKAFLTRKCVFVTSKTPLGRVHFDRKKPNPLGGFLFTLFPHQEP